MQLGSILKWKFCTYGRLVPVCRKVYLWTHRSRNCFVLLVSRKQVLLRLDWSTSSTPYILICVADARYNSDFLLLELRATIGPLNILRTLDNSSSVSQHCYFYLQIEGVYVFPQDTARTGRNSSRSSTQLQVRKIWW